MRERKTCRKTISLQSAFYFIFALSRTFVMQLKSRLLIKMGPQFTFFSSYVRSSMTAFTVAKLKMLVACMFSVNLKKRLI